MMRINGRTADQVSARDRGLLYGDGLFETIRIVDGNAPLWDLHMSRLERSCRDIGLACPERSLLWREVKACGDAGGNYCVRMTLTRGAGPRGYAPPPAAEVTLIVEAFSPPRIAGPLEVVICDRALGSGSPLAGMKHLSRLENVLAARSVHDSGADDGLLFDDRGRLIEGLSSNVFVLLGDRWVTPDLATAGVAGVYRSWLLDRGAAEVGSLAMEDVRSCSGMFLANAVRGIIPVNRIRGVKELPVEPVIALESSVGEPWSAE